MKNLRDKMKIKIAVPSKGRISEPSINILEKAGLGLIDKNNRKLISKTFNEDIEVMFARASDIPEFVADGWHPCSCGTLLSDRLHPNPYPQCGSLSFRVSAVRVPRYGWSE